MCAKNLLKARALLGSNLSEKLQNDESVTKGHLENRKNEKA